MTWRWVGLDYDGGIVRVSQQAVDIRRRASFDGNTHVGTARNLTIGVNLNNGVTAIVLSHLQEIIEIIDMFPQKLAQVDAVPFCDIKVFNHIMAIIAFQPGEGIAASATVKDIVTFTTG